jgi:primosomal protein N' (replication factor Y)
MVQLHPAFNLDESNHAFSEKELILLKRLQHESLAYSDIAKLLGTKHLYTILKSLTGKEAIILFEEVREKYRPKTEKKIRLTAQYATSDALEKLFNFKIFAACFRDPSSGSQQGWTFQKEVTDGRNF